MSSGLYCNFVAILAFYLSLNYNIIVSIAHPHEIEEIYSSLTAGNDSDMNINETVAFLKENLFIVTKQSNDNKKLLTILENKFEVLTKKQEETASKLERLCQQNTELTGPLPVVKVIANSSDDFNLISSSNHSFNSINKNLNNSNTTEQFQDISDPSDGNSFPKNCDEILQNGDNSSGVRYILPAGSLDKILVYCDQKTQDGGWTIIQRRMDLPIRENFYRKWNDYMTGFGNRTGEYWLGLEAIHLLTKSTPMQLKIFLEDADGEIAYANYETFSLGNSSEKYTLHLGKYSGDAGDSLAYHNEQKFSTRDRDNDGAAYPTYPRNCAVQMKGGWWYRNCANSNLNGLPFTGKFHNNDRLIYWSSFRGSYYGMKSTAMMIKLIDREEKVAQ